MKISPIATSLLLSLMASASPVFADDDLSIDSPVSKPLVQKIEEAPAAASETMKGATPAAANDGKNQADDSKDIVLTSPAVRSGLKLHVSERTIVIGKGQLLLNGRLIDITEPFKVTVPPSGPLSVNDEMVKFTDQGKPIDTIILQKSRAATNDFTILRGILVPDSVKVKAAPGADGAPFSPFRDFTVEYKFGGVRVTPAGNLKQGDRAFVDYKCWRRRIDTIAFDLQANRFVLVQGVPARSAPEPPEGTNDMVPLANVYSDWGDGALPREDVMPISELVCVPDQKLVEHNRRAMAPIIKKLESGDPVNIVIWGDGVAQGFDARSKECAYVNILTKQLHAAFPKAQITLSNLGISRSTSNSRLPLLKLEVFALKPDLVIAEFSDDFGLPSHVLQGDYETLLDQAQKAGVRVILTLTHGPSPRISKTRDWDTVADRPIIPVMHELADKNEYVALADVFRRFNHLPKEGLRPDMLFIDGMDRPNNRGHAIYAEELLRCFVTPSQIASQK